jgi:glycine cleavage system aminomethyltransferase T
MSDISKEEKSMSTDNELTMGGTPAYPDINLYMLHFNTLAIREGDGWKEESLSWKKSCYIHSGLSGTADVVSEVTFKGPEAQKLLSAVSINDCYKWPVGMSKHLVMCDENGYVANHGLAVRDGEDSFRTLATFPWAAPKNAELNYNVEISFRILFIHQIAGPLSLQVLEKATGESLRDVKFLAFRPTKIPGIDAPIEVSRIGMAGTLAYELRGPIEAGPAVYDTVYQAGKPLGMKRLGWRTYTINHTEGGFPQQGCTFLASTMGNSKRTGSVDPADLKARFRTPGEVGWGWMAKFDHDFIGRKAVEAEAANPKRKIVTLRWNPEDVVDINASLLKPGEEYKTIELPSAVPAPSGGNADHVTKNGKKIGISTTTIYSYYYREVISHCTIDIDQAQIGNEVIVHWGDYGKRTKEVRAIVARFPYLDLPRNENYDLSTVPSGI